MPGFGRISQRQLDSDRCAFVRTLASCRDRAAVQFDDALHERESQPEPAATACDRSVSLCIRLEYCRERDRIDPDAGVVHADICPMEVNGETDGHRAAAVGELLRVSDQVAENLNQSGLITDRPHWRAGH